MELDVSDNIHDYAASAVPESHRKWRWISVTNVLIGVATAMFFMAWGGELTKTYGTITTIIAMISGTIVIGGAGTLFSLLGARYGLSSNLLSRELYGSYGSAVVTVLYSINYIMFYAFEGAIMTSAVIRYYPGVNHVYLFLIYTIFMLFITVYGMTSMTRFMWITLPIYILSICLLLLLPHGLTTNASNGVLGLGAWLGYHSNKMTFGNIGGSIATVFALITMSTQGADYGRMLRKCDIKVGSIALGFGVMFMAFCVVTILGSYFSVASNQTNPGIYFVGTLGFFGLLVVMLTQARINMVNMYSGSLALTNTLHIIGFHRLHIIRPVMSLVIAICGVALIAVGILGHMLIVLTVEGLFIMSWGGCLISYYWLSGRPLSKSPTIEKSKLKKFESTGMLTLVISLSTSLLMQFGLFGESMVSYSSLVNIIISLSLPIIIYKVNQK